MSIARIPMEMHSDDSLKSMCPYKRGPMVGSMTCSNCEFFVRMDKTSVYCNHPTEEKDTLQYCYSQPMPKPVNFWLANPQMPVVDSEKESK